MKKIIVILLLVVPAFAYAQQKVGVGTTSPAQRLSVDSTLNIDQGNFDDGTRPAFRFGDGSTGEAIGSRRTSGGNNPYGLDFWTSNTKRMVISNAGFVGIATDNPQAALSVNGDVLVDYNATNNGVTGYSLRFGNSGSGEGISSARSGSINPNGINLFTNFTPRLSVTNNGYVGIGTTFPLSALHTVAKAGDQYIIFAEASDPAFAFNTVSSTAATSYVGEFFARTGTSESGFVGINPNNDVFLGRNNSSIGLKEALIVSNSTGNVGINVATPLSALHTVAKAGEQYIIFAEASDPAFAFNTVSSTAATSYVGEFFARTGTSASGFVGINPNNDVFLGRNNSSIGLKEAITVSNTTGNVGIGTGTPTAKLQIIQAGLYTHAEGNSNALEIIDAGATNHTLYMGADATNQLSYIQSVATGGFRDLLLQGRGGNVLIGKDVNSLLQVKGDIVADNNGANNGSVNNGIRFGTSSSGEGIASKRSSGGNQNGLDFYTAGNNRMTISNNGKIGMEGQTSPGFPLNFANTLGEKIALYGNSGNNYGFGIQNAMLQIHTDAFSADIVFGYGSSASLSENMRIKGNGNVGIGKSNPSEKLDVTGNGAFSGTLTVQAGKGIMRNTSSTQLKTQIFNVPIVGPLNAGSTTVLSVTFPEGFSANPAVYVAGINAAGGSAGHAECVYNTATITSTGFALYIYNPRGSNANFVSGTTITIQATGAQ